MDSNSNVLAVLCCSYVNKKMTLNLKKKKKLWQGGVGPTSYMIDEQDGRKQNKKDARRIRNLKSQKTHLYLCYTTNHSIKIPFFPLSHFPITIRLD